VSAVTPFLAGVTTAAVVGLLWVSFGAKEGTTPPSEGAHLGELSRQVGELRAEIRALRATVTPEPTASSQDDPPSGRPHDGRSDGPSAATPADDQLRRPVATTDQGIADRLNLIEALVQDLATRTGTSLADANALFAAKRGTNLAAVEPLFQALHADYEGINRMWRFRPALEIMRQLGEPHEVMHDSIDNEITWVYHLDGDLPGESGILRDISIRLADGVYVISID